MGDREGTASVGVTEEPLLRVVMGHEGQRSFQGEALASFTGRDAQGNRHSYRMPYSEWVASDRPTIITVTISEGVG